MTEERELIKESKPNGWRLRLVCWTFEGNEPYWTVYGPDADGRDPDDGDQSYSLADAEARYEAEAKRLATTPNWEAQARYDDAHGTINGYAPWQYNQER